MDWRDKVTAEKSLLDVFWKARKVASARSNRHVAVLAFLVLLVLFYVDRHFEFAIFSTEAMSSLIEQAGDVGFTLTTAILGFLIAGFSIFSSITKPEIFAALAKLDHKDSGLSRLQFIFFNFLLVFIHYLAFLAVSIAIKIFLPVVVEAAGLIEVRLSVAHAVVWWVGATLIAVVLAWLVFLVMLLKSFIWNIYQAVLVVIVTGDLITQMERDAKQKANGTGEGGA